MDPNAAPDAKADIGASVDRICDSVGFRRSARLKRFLRFLASTQTSGGQGPKEYEIAREVYDKPESFDCQIDPIVRVEASRLRLRLIEYYQGKRRVWLLTPVVGGADLSEYVP